MSGPDPGAPRLGVTQICKDVKTNVEGDPCHDMFSMTQVLNHATLKTYPSPSILLSMDIKTALNKVNASLCLL